MRWITKSNHNRMKDKLESKILSKDYLIKQLKEEVGVLREEIKKLMEKQNTTTIEEKKDKVYCEECCYFIDRGYTEGCESPLNIPIQKDTTTIEEKKDKVYCEECCYFIDRGYTEGCESPLNIPIQKDTHIKKEIIYKKPSELNQNNDCSLYRKYNGKLYYELYYGR